MALIRIGDLVSGMVLAGDVRVEDGRLLAAAGTALTDRHVQILRKWGVEQVDVREASAGDNAPTDAPPTPADEAAVNARVAALFERANEDHPAVQELRDLTRGRMLREMMGASSHAR